MERATGFPNQRLVVVPRPLVREALERPITRRLVVTDAGVRKLAQARNLRRLRLRGKLTDDSLETLARLPKLTALSIGGKFTEAGFRALARLDGLRHLEVTTADQSAAKGIAELHRAKRALNWFRIERSPPSAALAILRRAFGKGLIHYGPYWEWRAPP